MITLLFRRPCCSRKVAVLFLMALAMAATAGGCGTAPSPMPITDTTSNMDGYIYIPARVKQAGDALELLLYSAAQEGADTPVPDGTQITPDKGGGTTTSNAYFALSNVPIGLRSLTITVPGENGQTTTYGDICVGPTATTHGKDIPPQFRVVFGAPDGWWSENDTLQLTAALYVGDREATAYDEFIWSASDTTLATVDQTGLVTALKPGQLTITAKLGPDDGAPSASIPFTVIDPLA